MYLELARRAARRARPLRLQAAHRGIRRAGGGADHQPRCGVSLSLRACLSGANAQRCQRGSEISSRSVLIPAQHAALVVPVAEHDAGAGPAIDLKAWMAGRCVCPCSSVAVPAARSARATLSALTSVMAYSHGGGVRLAAGARGARERAARCDRQREKLALPVGVAHGGAQPLIGAIVGAQRIAVHHQHRLAVQGDDHGVGQQIARRSCGRIACQSRKSRLPCMTKQARRCEVSARNPCDRRRFGRRPAHHRRPRTRTDRRGCTGPRRCAPRLLKKLRNCSVIAGRLASMCRSEMKSAATRLASVATRSIRSMMTGFSGASSLNGPCAPVATLPICRPLPCPESPCQTPHIPSGSGWDRARRCRTN